MNESYKKWIPIGIIAVAVVIIIISMSRDKKSPPVTRPSRTAGSTTPSGPMVDKDFREVIPLEELGADLKDPRALSLLGDKYFEERKFAQAIEIYKKGVDLMPGDADTYNDLGLAYYYTGNASGAIEALKKGIAADPSYQRLWLSLGFINMAAGQNDEARNALQKASELDPESDIGKEAVKMMARIK